jgi:CheY-like chemotaxis protein
MIASAKDGLRPLRVLVVDDNRDAADSLALLITLWGHETRVAYDGFEALQAARAYAPDCMLVDIGMPRLDGYHLAKRLRADEELRKAKLVALTAYSDEHNIHRAWEAGFDYHFVKPADPEMIRKLLAMLDKMLKLTEKTEPLAQQTGEMTKETKWFLTDVKEEMKECKEDIKEVKQGLREIKHDLRDVRGSGQNSSNSS